MAAGVELEIVGVDRIDGDKIIVNFSNATEAVLTIQDVLQVLSTRTPSGGTPEPGED
jgi:hypothetical protein